MTTCNETNIPYYRAKTFGDNAGGTQNAYRNV